MSARHALRTTLSALRSTGSVLTLVGVLALSGCATGVTVAGAPTGLPSEAAPTPTPLLETPTPSSSPTPEQVTPVEGPTVDVKGATGAGRIQLETYTWRTQGQGSKALPPEHGSYLVLDLAWTATEGTLTVNPLYVKLRGGDGTEYQPTMGVDGNEPVLATRKLNTGETATGIVAFDVPRENVTVVFTDETGIQAAQVAITA
ncbi:DUF4352 domain-containing protein [Granulicoccus phenolivorans]|uniref:DUF4352 domain-containing protein n=1 Tax=Granulicoccus phenolivorans TaxID=266854 RepID=UPI00047E33FE|nr:DUF4352 domain-containing protein [Granulicoccus phenolivorans]